VEGYLDVIACHTAGVDIAVASLGTSMSDDHAKLLKRWCDEVTILYDSDDAGQKAAARASEMLLTEGLKVKVALMPKGEDPDTLLRTAGPAAVQQAVEKGISPLDYKMQSIRKKLTPDTQEFWDEVAMALASATSLIEVDRHLLELATMYPGTKDRMQAQRSIRSMVARYRKASATPRPQNGAAAARSVAKAVVPKMLPAEATLFKALMTFEFRQQAWEALNEEDLLVTQTALELAASVQAAFPDGIPAGEAPAQWLHQIEPEHLRDVLAQVEFQEHLMLSDRFVQDSISDLRSRRAKRELRNLIDVDLPSDEARLKQIMQELRRSKGVPDQAGDTY
jgi:DNA primase